jgi:folate-binding protein YgfZ
VATSPASNPREGGLGLGEVGTATPSRLIEGKAFADLSGWRKVAVSGPDALEWLNDLVSADLSDLRPGRARRSLLLSPTGRIRAEFTVALSGGSLLLLQDPTQPRSVEDLLAPYVLSSDVTMEDRSRPLSLFAMPGREVPPNAPGAASSTPSCLGPGVDLISAAHDGEGVLRSLRTSFHEATEEELEAWRVEMGRARWGVDGTDEDLPKEAGMEEAVALDKGCYLGQEAVARVRNLGHPRRVLLRLRSESDVARGDAVLVDGREAGRVTSVASAQGGTLVLARVRWDARRGPFTIREGVPLEPGSPL